MPKYLGGSLESFIMHLRDAILTICPTKQQLREELADYQTIRDLTFINLLPSWSEGVAYQAGSVVRISGGIYQTRTDIDASQCPFLPLSDDDGNILIDDDGLAIISDEIDTLRWKKLFDAPAAPLNDSIDNIYSRLRALEDRIDEQQHQLDQLLPSEQ